VLRVSLEQPKHARRPAATSFDIEVTPASSACAGRRPIPIRDAPGMGEYVGGASVYERGLAFQISKERERGKCQADPDHA